jgi:hypothetical protein
MIRRINVNIFPSGSQGYLFLESDGTKLRGKSWPGLTRVVTAYRKLNGLPVGNVYDEVMAQACARNPSLCKDVPSAAPPATARPPSLKGRVLSWLSSLARVAAKQPLEFVQDSEMRQRAAVCASCPASKPLPEGCSTCKQAMSALRGKVLGPQRLNACDKRIGACERLGCDLQAAAWLNESRVREDSLPSACWRKVSI